MAHIGQELALGLVGALGAELFGLVLAGQFGQLFLAVLEVDHGLAQRVLVDPARLFLGLQRGDVGGGDHQAAFGRGALGDLHPAAVDQLGLAHALAAAQGLELLAHGQLGLSLQLLARHAGLQNVRFQAEEAAIVAVAHQEAPVAVPQDEGFRDAFDSVAQAGFGGLGAGLGQAFLGHVEGHADDPRIAALGRLAEALAARVDPHRPAGRQAGHPERHIETAIDRGSAERFAQAIAVAFGDAVQHLLAVHHAAAPAEQGRGDVGHEDPVGFQIPLPDAAAGGLDGQAEALLAVGIGRVEAFDAARLSQQHQAQREGRGQRNDQPEQLLGRTLRRVGQSVGGDAGVEHQDQQRRHDRDAGEAQGRRARQGKVARSALRPRLRTLPAA